MENNDYVPWEKLIEHYNWPNHQKPKGFDAEREVVNGDVYAIKTCPGCGMRSRYPLDLHA